MNNFNIKITHLSSVHPRHDTRIFLKMCSSLSLSGYNTSLIVADGKGNEIKNGISILDIGAPIGGRLYRMAITTNQVFKKAKELDSSIYHIHDPELIPIGLKLKKLGKKVIFDVHENIALQIKDKKFIPFFLRSFISILYRKYEISVVKKFDALILAEQSYLNYYSNLNDKIEVVLNMPDLNLLKNFKNTDRKKNEIFYIGGISNLRGFDVTIDAIKILKEKFPDIIMHFIGPYSPKLVNSADIYKIENNIKFYGFMSLEKGLEYSKSSKIGISILKPIKNYTDSFSTKIFEYMAVGLPVVTSNFKLYKNIIEKYKCGICVNPLNSKEIADAIEYIIKNPVTAKQMGLNGIKATEEIFNWEKEKKKMFNLYKNLV